MGELEALLAQLGTLFGGSAPVAGPPAPGASFAGPGGTMTGNPNSPTGPGGTGSAGIMGLIAQLLGKGGAGGSGIGIQQILSLITALGGGQYGSEQLNAMKALYQQQQMAAQRAMNAKQIAARGVAATVPLTKAQTYFGTQAADANAVNAGMGESPGATASAVSRELAPLYQENLAMGNQNAQFGFPYQFETSPPDYTAVLNELNTLGRNTGPYGLPSGVF